MTERGEPLIRLQNLARQVAEDDRAVRTDESLLTSNIKLSYAIDASELFSYVFLNTLPFLRTDKINNFVLSLGFNEMVLHELLFSRRYTLFLTPSHRLEFQQLEETIHERDLSELAEHFSAIEGKLKLSKRLVSAINRFMNVEKDTPLGPALVSEIINEAASNAPSILLLARHTNAHPQQRLSYLQKHMNLSTFQSVLPAPLPIASSSSDVFKA